MEIFDLDVKQMHLTIIIITVGFKKNHGDFSYVSLYEVYRPSRQPTYFYINRPL